MSLMEQELIPPSLTEALLMLKNEAHTGITFISGSQQETFVPYNLLYTQALSCLGYLQQQGMQPGNELVLQVDDNHSFLVTFWAALMGGIRPVPLAVAHYTESNQKLCRIWKILDHPYLLTNRRVHTNLEKSADDPAMNMQEILSGGRLLLFEDMMQHEQEGNIHKPAADDIAFIQFSSGSTGTPKGVTLTHNNVITNVSAIISAGAISKADATCSWMPLTHDMGLIGFHLVPLVSGAQQYMMPTDLYIRRPALWLQVLSAHKATLTSSPNFGYKHLLQRLDENALKDIDLSSVRLIFNGAEPISMDLCRTFLAAMQPYGLHPDVMFTVYGLAEATLAVAFPPPARPLTGIRLSRLRLGVGQRVKVDATENQVEFANLGKPVPNCRIRITNEKNEVLDEGKVGYVQISGDNVTKTYYNNPAATKEVIKAGWLNTYDLGFVLEGNLFITGRAKDIIFAGGLNYYAHDIERIAEELDEIDTGRIVACGVPDIATQTDALVLFVLYKKSLESFYPLTQALKALIAARLGIRVQQVVPVKHIPKTTSGKIKRFMLLDDLLKGEYNTVLEELEKIQPAPEPAALAAPPLQELSAAVIRQHIIQFLSGRLQVRPENIDPSRAFAELGVTSMIAVELAGHLGQLLQRELDTTLAWNFANIQALTEHLSGAAVQTTTAAADHTIAEPIAIIGLACRFPGAENAAAYWELLKNGTDVVGPMTAARRALTPMNGLAAPGGYISNIDAFDAAFFGVSPKEAPCMDPQQRIMMEVCWEALEHAGLTEEKLTGSDTSVFIGVSGNDYARMQLAAEGALSPYAGTGSAFSILANRLSYFLDLKGPSMAIDTACSSSLVALHQACNSIRNGESRMAITGGVNLLLSPELNEVFGAASMLSEDGKCKTFDANANGYVRGEGCGVVILKKLSAAMDDGDSVLAVISGSAINQDGRSNGLTAPNGLSQQTVIMKAMQQAGLTPAAVSYIEAHGTGTPLGDPIEMNALKNVLMEEGRQHPLWIGAAKASIGHLEAAAGIAGVIKTVLALQHREIPAQLNFQSLNPNISLQQLPMHIPVQHTTWEVPEGKKRVAGISSFGFGGTNSHVLITEAAAASKAVTEAPHHLLLLSAKNKTALQDLCRKYISYLQQDDVTLTPVCYTAATARTHFPYRLAVSAANVQEVQAQLQSYLQAADITAPGQRKNAPRAAFLFTGQGVQYTGMGKTLYQTYPVFKDVIDKCGELLQPWLPVALTDVLFNPAHTTLLHQTAYTQPALFAFEYALAQLWMAFGIQPTVVIGHSVGEYAAACIAGVFSLEDAVKLIAKRGQLMQQLPAGGEMMAIFTTADAVDAQLATLRDTVSIAAINGPKLTVIAGAAAGVQQVAAHFTAAGIRTKTLQVSHAFHSPLMQPMVAAFKEAADTVTYHKPNIKFISNLNGEVMHDALATPEYWTQHILAPVQFEKGIHILEQTDCTAWMEIGPAPSLLTMCRDFTDTAARLQVMSVKPGQQDLPLLLEALGALYVNGAHIQWQAVYHPWPCARIPLPAYPFQHQQYWIEKPVSHMNKQEQPVMQHHVIAPVAAPKTATTGVLEAIQNIMAAALHAQPDQLDVQLPFLEMGADSIVLVEALSKIEKIYGIKISIAQVFEELSTIQALADYIEEQNGPAVPTMDSIAAPVTVPVKALPMYQQLLQEMEALSLDYVIQALQELHMPLRQGHQFRLGELAQQLRIAKPHYRLLRRILEMLEEGGVLQQYSDVWEVLQTPMPVNPQQRMAACLEQYPEAQAELMLLQRCAAQLPAVLTGVLNPLEVLFPKADTNGAAQVYTNSFGAQVLNTCCQEAVSAWLPLFPQEKTVKILEIGGGTGGTTTYVLKALNTRPVEYTFTDISTYLLHNSKQQFSAYPFVDFRKLDIEQDPIAQHYPQHGYDMIIAANVLHATKNMTQTLQHVRSLLAPGGVLMLIEGVRKQRWLDLTFGLTEGWWRFEDQQVRPDYPLMSREMWMQLLTRTGFQSAEWSSPMMQDQNDFLGYTFMIAQAVVTQMPVAVAPATALPAAILPASNNALENILLKQMELMNAQLQVLKGMPVGGDGAAVMAQAPVPVVMNNMVAAETSMRGQAAVPTMLTADERSAAMQERPAVAMRSSTAPIRAAKQETVKFNPVKLAEDKPLSFRQLAFLENFIQRYNAKTGASKEFAQQHRRVLSDWINSLGFRQALKEVLYPIVSAHSAGAHFTDIDGNEYVDIAMGFGVNFFGNSPAFVTAAIQEQLTEGYELATQSDLAGEVANLVHELTGVERVTFTNTGTEAVMNALRIARTKSGKGKVAVFKGYYHGTFDGLLAQSHSDGSSVYTSPVAPGTTQGMVEDMVLLNYGTDEALEYIIANAHELGGVLVEPVQSRRPGFFPKDFLLRLRQITAEKNIPFILDEIITGFRMHPGGMQAKLGIQADIVTYGKIAGGGMPIGIVAGKAAFLDAIDGGWWNYGDDSYPGAQMTVFGGTFCRHPLAMAAARAVLQHIKKAGTGLQDGVNEKTARLAAKLNTFFEACNVSIRMVHFGSLFRFEPFGKYNPLLQPIEMDVFFYMLIEKGIYTWERRICFLSAAHTDRDLDLIVQKVKETILEMMGGGFFPEARYEDTVAAPAMESLIMNSHAPLTAAQQQLWVLAQMEEAGSQAYNVHACVQMEGPVQVEALHQALQKVTDRHEALRTSISADGEQQIINAQVAVCFSLADCSNLAGEAQAAAITQWKQEKSQVLFDGLQQPSLFRADLLRTGPATYLLLLTVHHIVSDGWSIGVLLQDLASYYTGICTQQNITLETPQQFREYIRERDQQLTPEQRKQHTAYWLQKFAGAQPVLALPLDHARPPVKTYTGASLSKHLDPAMMQEIKTVSKQNGVTPFMTLLAAYMLLMHKLSGQDEVIVGIPASGRFATQDENTIGYCAGILPLHSQLAAGNSLADHMKAVKQEFINSLQHQDVPMADWMQQLDLPQDLSSTPLFSTVFNVNPAIVNAAAMEFHGLHTSFLPLDMHFTAYDLIFDMMEENGEWVLSCVYNTDLFEAATVQRFADFYEIMLRNITTSVSTPVAASSILTVAEQQQLLAFNDTVADFPDDKTLAQLFEEQVLLRPDATAVVFEEKRLSFAELNEKANQLAHYLQTNYQLGPNDLVALIMDRSEWMVIALLGTLKAGAAYVPIATEYPLERVHYILNDTKARVAITDNAMPELPIALPLAASWATIAAFNNKNPEHSCTATALAYVIYTSASTGQPKGVMVAHKGVVNRLHWQHGYYNITPADVVLQKTPYVFDVSVWEFFVPLCYGARLVLCPKDAAYDPELLTALVATHGITQIHFVPSMLGLFLQALDAEKVQQLLSLKQVYCSGEALKPEFVKQFFTVLSCGLHNHYGPTEASVEVSNYSARPNDVVIPIGKPISNLQLYVLDKALQLAPIGVTGELYIGGVGLAKGYWNQPALTKEKFISNPHKANDTLYHTGDIARWLPDGNVEYLGRTDQQVEIRGYRIETGEIEHALAEHEQVKDVVVLARSGKGAEPYLAAYFTSEVNIESAVLRSYLLQRLPEYMVPAWFIQLGSIPLNVSGKADRKSLPDPEVMGLVHNNDFIAPRNTAETTLAGLWEEVLGHNHISVQDRFFEVGGQSLKAARLAARIQQAFQVRVPLRQLFRHTTIEEQAMMIERAGKKETAAIEVIPEQPYYEVSQAQRRLWMMNEFETAQTAFNMTGAAMLEGQLDINAFREAFQQLINRHEILRTTFIRVDGEPKQVVHTQTNFAVTYIDLRKEAAPQQQLTRLLEDAAKCSFNLEQGPLMQVLLIQLQDEVYRISFTMHHIISDGWSLEILINEVWQLYGALVQQKPAPLAPLRLQYKDYAHWRNQQMQQGAMEAHRRYWLKQFEGEVPVLHLPADKARPAVKTHRGSTAWFMLDAALSATIDRMATETQVTPFSVLLAAVNLLLYRYTGQKDLVVGVPIGGRDHPELENQIGFYTNMIAVRNQLPVQRSFKEVLTTTEKCFIEAYEHGVYPFNQVVEDLHLQRDPGRSHLFDVMLQYESFAAIHSTEERFAGITLRTLDIDDGASKFDLTFAFKPVENGLQLSINYSTDLFLPATIAAMKDELVKLLNAVQQNMQLTPVALKQQLSGTQQEQWQFATTAISVDF